MRPEIVGPIAGATDITIETRPMNRPRSDGATSVMSVVMSSGIMIAVPVACTTRAEQQHLEARRERGEQRAGREQAHRRDEDRPRGDALQQEARDRDHDRHREHERRGQPLGLRERDVEVGDEVRDRDAHDRLVEEDDEGGAEQQPDDAVVARAVVGLVGDDGSVLCGGVGRGIEDAVTGHPALGDARRFKVWEGAFGHGIGSNRFRRTAAPGRASISVE